MCGVCVCARVCVHEMIEAKHCIPSCVYSDVVVVAETTVCVSVVLVQVLPALGSARGVVVVVLALVAMDALVALVARTKGETGSNTRVE